jgi:hypothetical protein
LGGKSIALAFSPRMMRFLFSLALAFEPLAPTAISYYISRSLRTWKQQGLINDYKIHAQRLGKIHYRVIVDLEVNKNQVHHFFAHVLPKRSKILGRWLNV